MKLLTLTTLYPNAAAPAPGVFVENRLEAWRRRSGGEAVVIAPVPWFPFSAPIFGRYARYAAAPSSERRGRTEVFHPRYFLLPKIGMGSAPAALARVFEATARNVRAAGYDFDLIDAHYLYPDGVAAIRAAAALGKGAILTARGSDVTLLAKFPRPRAMILDAVRRADAVVAVAGALKDELVRLGAPAEKIAVLRNGVDLEKFRPLDRNAIRLQMNLSGPVVASVGSLIDRKGHDVVIRAIAQIPDATLLIAGEGPAGRRLKSLAMSLGVENRVRFLGPVAHEALGEIYNAADALALASDREGWPNVLLEAMACGAPAVAADAGGCREVIRAPEAGRIVDSRDAADFAAALRGVIASSDRSATRKYAEAHSWEETSRGLSSLYDAALARRRARANATYHPVIAAPPPRPKLIFTIDTEEQFDWSEFSRDRHRLNRPLGVDRLQKLCEDFGVKPLYFATYPIMTDAENAGYFRLLAEEGRADLGLHLHQWTTPPFDGFEGEYYSWQGNLPAGVHFAKLRALKDAFERAFSFSPIAHRAGRYGVTPEAYREIAEIGVTMDFSPAPPFDFSGGGGPDFSATSNEPFRIETDRGDVFVTPVCGANAIRGGRRFLGAHAPLGLSAPARPRARRFTAPMRLSCEQARFEELTALTESLAANGTPVLTFSLHSTTLTPGASPYAPDEAAVDAALALTRRYLDFFTKDFRGETVDLASLAALYGAQR